MQLLFFANTAHSQAVHGYLDSVIYSEIDHSLAVFGWAASEKQNIVATNILIDMDGMQIYQGRMLRSERIDVAENTGRQDWLASGFQISIRLPDSIEGGVHNVRVRIRLSNGEELVLPAASSASSITLPTRKIPSVFIRFAVLLGLTTPLAVLLGGH